MTLNIPNYVYRIVKFTIDIIAVIFVIPFTVLLTLTIKYSFNTDMHIAEYIEKPNFGPSLEYLSIPCVVLLLIISYLKIIFSGQIGHHLAKSKINAKAHSEIETLGVYYTFSLALLYGFIAKDNIFFLQIFVVFFSWILMVKILKTKPYFSLFFTCVNFVKYFLIGWIAFLFIIGNVYDNSMFIGLAAIVTTPILAALMTNLVIFT